MKGILGNQSGIANIEAMIIMACFAFVAVIAILAMFSQGGIDTEDIAEAVSTIEADIEEIDWQEAKEEAQEAKEELTLEACLYFCELDYNNGLSNVVEYEQCLSNCSQ